ncbi:MAG: MATE family efflux transporter [Chitinophagaceae bacterium]|nr:MATE family efflux transporter [Chitinophagaceae bacterium]
METALPKNDLQLEITNRQILSISLPISLSLLVPFLNFTANNFFLSGLGESALGTAGITGVYFLVVAVIGNGLNNAIQSLIARRAGENRLDEIGRIFSQGVRIAIAFSALGILLTYLFAPAIFNYALRTEGVETKAVEFLLIRVWGLPFLYLFQMGNAFLVGTNNSRYLMIGTLFEAGANIFFDYGFIYGHFGLPELGFNGAAYASVLAEFIGMIVVFLFIFLKKLNVRFHLFSYLRYNKELTKLILNISAPLIGQFSISLISWLVFYILIEHHGERALAVSNVMRNIFALAGVFIWAFASTTNAMVSNIIGQGRTHDVQKLIYRIMKLSLYAAIGMFVLFNVFAGELLSFFKLSRSFIEEAIPVLRIVTTGMLFMSVSVVWLNAVTGTGNTRMNLMIEAVTILLYLIYIYLVLEVFHLNLIWAWASELLYWSTILTMSFFYIRSGRWKGKVI